jgi:hypothetical protein
LARHRRLTEAHEEVRAACRRDPQFYVARIVLALTAAGLGNKEEAVAALREARRLRPRLSLNEIQLLVGVAQRFSLLSGARCRNPHSDHHHFRAGAGATPRANEPSAIHFNLPVRGIRAATVPALTAHAFQAHPTRFERVVFARGNSLQPMMKRVRVLCRAVLIPAPFALQTTEGADERCRRDPDDPIAKIP